MANNRYDVQVVVNAAVRGQQAVTALNRQIDAAQRAAASFQRVYERAYQSISRAERQRADASARASRQAQAAAEAAASRQQRVYEQAYAAIGRAEARRAAESARLARQSQAAQEQAARAAQRSAEQVSAAQTRAAQRAAAAQAQADRQRQRLGEQINRQLSQAEARRAADAARSAQAEQRAREAAARAWIRAQLQAIRENQRNQERAAQQAIQTEARQRREQERLARQWARASAQAQRDAERQQQAGSGGGSGLGAAIGLGAAAGAAAGLAVTAVTAAVNLLTGAIQQAASAYRDFMAEGIRFNAQLETTKLAIQSLIAGNLITSGSVKDVGQAFAIAGPQAEDQLRKLRIEALASTATFEGLAAAFQQAIGPGLAKGLNLDQIRQLTLQIGQAGKALGQSDFELPQEVRAILEGKIDRNARVANALQITSADIAKFKGNADGLFNYLNEKTKAYRLAGELAANTFAGLLGNVKEVFTFFAAESSIKTFGSLKSILGDIQKQFLVIKRDSKGAITDVQIAPAYKELAGVLDRIGVVLTKIAGGLLAQLTGGARSLGEFLSENREQVGRIFDILNGIASDLLTNINGALRAVIGNGNEWLDATETSLQLWKDLLDIIGKTLIGALKTITDAMQVFNRIVQGASYYFEQAALAASDIAPAIRNADAAMNGLISSTLRWASLLPGPLGALAAIARIVGSGVPGTTADRKSPLEIEAEGLSEQARTIALSRGMAVAMNAKPKGTGGGKGGGGGSKTDPVLQALADRKAAREQEYEFQKTLLEAASTLAKQKIDEETAANEAAYADRTISLETYYAKKQELAERAKALEIRALELQKENEKKAYDETIAALEAAQKVKDPKKRADAERKASNDLADARNRLIKTENDLSVARSQAAQIGVQGSRDLTNALREEARAYDEILTNIKEMSGDRFGAARDRINAQADAEIENIRRSLAAEDADTPEKVEARNAREQQLIEAINRQREIRLADLNIQEKAAALQTTIAQVQATQAEIQLTMQQQGGVDAEIQRAKLKALQDQLATLRAQREALSGAVQANPTAENQNVLTDLDGQIRGLGNTSTTVAGQIRQTLYASFTNLFQSLMTGSQSAGEAFRAFASSVIGSITQMIAQMLALWAVQKLIGIVGAAFGAGVGSGAGGIGHEFGHSVGVGGLGGALGPPFAEGGYVTGPGGPKSDSIQARLSNGEFVVNAAATAKNRDILEAMNSGTGVFSKDFAARQEAGMLRSLRSQMPRSGSAPQSVPGVGTGGTSGFGDMYFGFFDDRKRQEEWLLSRPGQAALKKALSMMPNTVKRVGGSA